MKIQNTKNPYTASFKANKIAVVRPIIDGAAKEIEIYSLTKKDKNLVKKISDSVNLSKLLPSKVNAPNFSIWQKLIELTSDCMGNFSHQRIFLAVQENKCCGLLLATNNMKNGEVVTFATWPTAVEQKVKKAGSSLFTTFLNIASQKKLKKIKLEPILNGPTDAVGFYKAHGMDFPDKYASVMVATQSQINKMALQKSKELNYTRLKHPIKVNLENKLDI